MAVSKLRPDRWDNGSAMYQDTTVSGTLTSGTTATIFTVPSDVYAAHYYIYIVQSATGSTGTSADGHFIHSTDAADILTKSNFGLTRGTWNTYDKGFAHWVHRGMLSPTEPNGTLFGNPQSAAAPDLLSGMSLFVRWVLSTGSPGTVTYRCLPTYYV